MVKDDHATLSSLTSSSTLLAVARARVAEHGDATAYTFLRDGERDAVELTYSELDLRARAIAATLQREDVSGQAVLLLYPPGLDYITAFLGCIYAGAVAVPVYPPDPARLARTLPRLTAVIADARAKVALTSTAIRAMTSMFAHQAPALAGLRWLATDDLEAGLADAWREPDVHSETLAFIQYTSGSTAAPRGVMLSHGNLLHNSAAIHRCFQHGPNSRGVIWLPPYHDMGLIGGVLQPLCGGFPVVLMSPLDFLRRPIRWLDAISRYRATTSGGPNFAYDLCVKKITEAQLAALDLTSWDLAFNGAEPIQAHTLARFAEVFGRCGFRARAFYPCYGLAEATLIATGGAKDAPAVVRAFDRRKLERGEASMVKDGGSPEQEVSHLVGCGASLPDQELRIVAPDGSVERAAGRVGEIWLRGPSVAMGYWQCAEETGRCFGASLGDAAQGGTYLRTGDLGFVLDGELFVTGRLKDLVILRGRNLYPQDLEHTAAGAHPAARPGCTAAFSIADGGEERLVVVQEIERSTPPASHAEIVMAIRAAVAEQHEVQIDEVLLLAPGGIPKTSSGKVQRSACRAAFLEGALEPVTRSRVSPAPAAAPADAPAPAVDREALRAAPPAERRRLLHAYLLARVASTLGGAADLAAGRSLTALGLDSIRAVELSALIEDELGVTLPAPWLLDGRTLEELLAVLVGEREPPASGPASAPTSDRTNAARRDARSPVVNHRPGSAGPEGAGRPPLDRSVLGSPRLVARPAGAPAPVSYGQERLLFLERLAPGNSAYNVCAAALLEGVLDVSAMERSLAALVTRHEVLRTALSWDAGQPVARVLGAEGYQHWRPFRSAERVSELPWIEDRHERVAAGVRRAVELSRAPLDLERGAIVRCELIRMTSNEHLLVLAIHHVAVDGWSMGVLVRELGALYRAFLSGQPDPLPPLQLQYADYTAWQRQVLASGLLDEELAFWRSRLATAPRLLQLPSDRPRPAQPSFRGARHALRMSRELSAALRATARREDATLFMVLLAGFSVLLAQRTGRHDLVVGTDMANRDHAAIRSSIGLFVNQVVLRIDVAGAPTFLSLLARAREVCLGALAHHRVPFGKLVEELRPPRDAGYNPLFQVMFVLENAPMPRLELPGLSLRVLELDDGGSPFDLSMLLSDHGEEEEIELALRYSTALFDAATAVALAEDYVAVLEDVVAHPARPLAELVDRLHDRGRSRRRADAQALQVARAARFQRLQPRSSTRAADWVRFENLLESGTLPGIARPARSGIDLAGWIADHRELVQARIHEHGAVLFRGFGVTTATAFDQVIAAIAGGASPYIERSSRRSRVSGNIYTSTDHPADQPIFLHNEQSYNLTFPLRIFFCCVTAAARDGETPLADTRRVLQRIAPRVCDRFRELGYQYVRNFSPHLGMSWQEAFQTQDRAEVEAYCRDNQIDFAWQAGDRLRTRQHRRVAGRHPVTGDATWFNHATFFHVSTLPREVSATLRSQFAEDDLPSNTYYGDGTPIEPEVLDALRTAYHAELVRFPWAPGDVLAIDNMLVAHGRAPFTGQRLVLTGMAQPVRWRDVPELLP